MKLNHKPTERTTVAKYLAACTLIQAARVHRLREDRPVVLGLVVPEADFDLYETVLLTIDEAGRERGIIEAARRMS